MLSAAVLLSPPSHRFLDIAGAYQERFELLSVIDSLEGLSSEALAVLSRARVNLSAIAGQDVAIAGARVRFDEFNRLFSLARDGVPAVVIVPSSDDGLEDLIAFDQDNPNRFASLTGRLFALGDAKIDNRSTYHRNGHLRLHWTPLDWLASECDGAVIIEMRTSSIRTRLSAVPRIACPDIALGSWLRDQLRGSRTRPQILVPAGRRAA